MLMWVLCKLSGCKTSEIESLMPASYKATLADRIALNRILNRVIFNCNVMGSTQPGNLSFQIAKSNTYQTECLHTINIPHRWY